MTTPRSAPAGIGPIKAHQTMADYAFDVLRTEILTGKLRAGTRLSIDETTSRLGMSKMPMREALRRLEAVGLAENTPYRGTHVTELSIADLREVYQARLGLEPIAVHSAARRFTGEDVTRARELLDRLNAVEAEPLEAWPLHTAFHYVFYEAAGSTWLLRLIQPLWETSERYRFATDIEPRSATSRAEHERILQACASHDADLAWREFYNHLARTANAIARSMGAEPLFEILSPDRPVPLIP